MVEILCFGDSNTYGLIPGTKGRYSRDIRWTGILQHRLGNKGFNIIEEGLCGRTTVFDDELRDGRRGSVLLPVILESHQPLDVVILMLGTNDCKSHYKASANVIGRGIEKLIQQIRFNNNMKILLISPIILGENIAKKEYDPEFNEESIQTSIGLKEVYQEIADKYNIGFLAASDVAKASVIDQEHLDEGNHKKLADAIMKKLEELSWIGIT